MKSTGQYEFKHTTGGKYPVHIVGVTLLDEAPGYTGVYLRDSHGGLWPARTVRHDPPEHHRSVCAAWLSREGKHEDKRSVRP